MSPLPPAADRTLQAIGARRRVAGQPKVPEVIRTLREIAAGPDVLVALFDARSVAGERHLYSAWAHMGRARGRGEVRLRDRGAELALYVAGDDQLPRALEKVGVSDASDTLVLVAERPLDPRALLDRFGLVEDASVYPRAPDATTLDRLGIGADERGSVPSEAWEGLVLERVALIELSPASRKSPPAKG